MFNVLSTTNMTELLLTSVVLFDPIGELCREYRGDDGGLSLTRERWSVEDISYQIAAGQILPI
jgi:hypothetical protein